MSRHMWEETALEQQRQKKERKKDGVGDRCHQDSKTWGNSEEPFCCS